MLHGADEQVDRIQSESVLKASSNFVNLVRRLFVKRYDPSAEEAYNLIPLCVENVIGFIDAGELLCKSKHYAHGFIMA